MMRTKRKRQRRYKARFTAWILFSLIIFGLYTYVRPFKPLAFATSLPASRQTITTDMPWPADASAAIGAVGYGVLGTSSKAEEPVVPTASIAKMVTALSVLKQKPLKLGEQGPALTLTAADVQSYNDYYAVGGSIVKVAAGEKISEYQALEAMLLPSANNMADTLAKWSYGSLENYRAFANQYVKDLALDHTAIGTDASGLSPTTTSTASDIVRLGIAAMENPVIKQIVAKAQATVPVAGTIPNVNHMLGFEGVNGIKTGASDQAHGTLLFSADYEVAKGKHVTIVGSVMGAQTVYKAIGDAIPMLRAAKRNFTLDTVVKAGQSFGDIYVPWSNSTAHAIAKADAVAITWRHTISPLDISAPPIRSALSQGATIGSINFTGGTGIGTVPLVLDRPITAPGSLWRIVRW